MLKIFTVVGARPQFVKAAMFSRAVKRHNEAGGSPHIVEEIIHTGQHYDYNMSQAFFEEMGIPEPVVNLGIESDSHGAMTGRMLEALEREMINREPDWVLVYGDTNSTLAGALAAAKLHVPVAHIEAGLRSFNHEMPEEINRVLTDHVASLLLCPTQTAVANLKKEGITQGVSWVGDVMYDAALHFAELVEQNSSILEDLGLQKDSYFVATVHRAENTDVLGRLVGIIRSFEKIASGNCPIVFPVHPRTVKILQEQNVVKRVGNRLIIPENQHIHLIDPISYLDMVCLEKHAKKIITDSGGIQKEAYFYQVPCVTLRDETEWVETVESGWNQLAGADYDKIVRMAIMSGKPEIFPYFYGLGCAASACLKEIIQFD